MLTLAICDDDQATVDHMSENVKRIEASNSFLQFNILRFYGAESFCHYDSMADIDILLLDIEMPNINGISAAELFRKANRNASIIFITSHQSYMRECFHVRAVGFLDKPVNVEELNKIINFVYNEMHSKSMYVFRANKVTYQIPINYILYFKSQQHKIDIHTDYDQRYEQRTFYGKISKVAEELLPFNFVFVSKSTLVNLKNIKGKGPSHFLTSTDEKIPISPFYREHVNNLYMEFVERSKFL